MLLNIIKFMGVMASVVATLFFFYYLFWFVCLIDNACYYKNFGGQL